MTREQALKLADEVVSAWIANPPTNARGYADGWKVPTLAERTEAVVKIADFVWEVPAEAVPSNSVELAPGGAPYATLYGWVVGSDTMPTQEQYLAAKATIARVGPHSIVTAEEAAALASLVGTYEAAHGQPS